jgi:hypothetical protein
MLDGYIIKRIQEERERARKGAYQPLHIERAPPKPTPPVADRPEEDRSKRGSIVVDFRL